MDKRESVLDAINKLHQLLSACSTEATQNLGVMDFKVSQIHQLKTIDQHKHLTFSQFAKILNVTKPSVTEIVNKLIRLDCISKHQCTEDGRIYYIYLTGKSIARQESLRNKKLRDMILNILEEDEVETFVNLINKIAG